LGAKISAIACEVKIKAPGSPLGNYLLDVPAMVAAEVKKSATNTQQLLAAFQEAAEKRGVFQERISEQCLTSEVPEVLIEYSRLRDLTIVPVPEGDYFDQWYAESVIFGSGRPTVVLPHTRTRTGSFALNTVIVAWDFSRPAARAIADAMPILEKAKRVCVLTVTKEKAIDTRRSGAELAKHLARHGVDVVLDEVDAKGRSIGDVFEAHLTYRNANLLVMGAYGHSRIREFILGGATNRMLTRPPVPILLSH
jgi:nucleotide-binding universal stress UspA family protein